MLALSDKIPDVIIGLFAGAVVHEYLVQGLQGQVAFISISGGAVGIRPVLGDKGVQDTGLDHLAFDLVAVLNQGHGERAGVLQGVGGQLIEDLVVLGLLPFEAHSIVGIDGLQILDEQGQSALAAAGVANAEEGLAVGLFNRFLGQLFQGHSLGLFDDLLNRGKLLCRRRFFTAAYHQGKNHDEGQQQRQYFFHLFLLQT